LIIGRILNYSLSDNNNDNHNINIIRLRKRAILHSDTSNTRATKKLKSDNTDSEINTLNNPKYKRIRFKYDISRQHNELRVEINSSLCTNLNAIKEENAPSLINNPYGYASPTPILFDSEFVYGKDNYNKLYSLFSHQNMSKLVKKSFKLNETKAKASQKHGILS
jgi:hypothetical protein